MMEASNYPSKFRPGIGNERPPSSNHDHEAIFEKMIPEAVLIRIMTFVDFGAAADEPTCPAARMACVCKRWHRAYSLSIPFFVTNELQRIPGWTIQEYYQVRRRNPASDIRTIVDSWVRPAGSRQPHWWTSGYVFHGGRWTDNYQHDSEGGPFGVRPGLHPPKLRITFLHSVHLRAVVLAARNRPRRVILSTTSDASLGGHSYSMTIPPPNQSDLPEMGLSSPPVRSPQYMNLVACNLPQGNPPSEAAVARNSALPVVLPKALFCEKFLFVTIVESHERGWVGINDMALFE